MSAVLSDGTVLLQWCSVHRCMLLTRVGVNRWGTSWYDLRPEEVETRTFYGDPLPTELDICDPKERRAV